MENPGLWDVAEGDRAGQVQARNVSTREAVPSSWEEQCLPCRSIPFKPLALDIDTPSTKWILTAGPQMAWQIKFMPCTGQEPVDGLPGQALTFGIHLGQVGNDTALGPRALDEVARLDGHSSDQVFPRWVFLGMKDTGR